MGEGIYGKIQKEKRYKHKAIRDSDGCQNTNRDRREEKTTTLVSCVSYEYST